MWRTLLPRRVGRWIEDMACQLTRGKGESSGSGAFTKGSWRGLPQVGELREKDVEWSMESKNGSGYSISSHQPPYV